MLQTRVIPVLLLRNAGLVKTTKFKDEKYIGDPINAIKIFNEKEVDELIFLDIMASSQGKEPNYELIKDFASECFMPICYGGGVSTISQMEKIYNLGIEKISLSTAAIKNLDLLREASSIFGSSSVVVTLDIKKGFMGRNIHTNRGTKKLKHSIPSFALEIQAAGAGELMLNSIDRDGTMSGYDLDLIEEVTQVLDIPVIACGGAGNLTDFSQGKKAGASALAAGAFFVFHGKHRAVLITYPGQSELESYLQE